MEKEIEIGSVGKVDIDFNGGLAKVSISASVPGNLGMNGGAFVQCDSVQLLNVLFAALEKKLPPDADPIAETVKAVIITAVQAIK